MESFLKYVAEDIVKDYSTNGNIDMSNVVVVFPNKRASLFLNHELIKLVGHPVWCPTYITISDLFRQYSQLQVADPIKLICDLHKTFIECTGLDETLDHFYGWGQLLLADFDDIDKNLGDAQQIFLNIANLHELDDDSYLDEEKREILKKFFSNFTEGHHTELKRRFVELWSQLYNIYVKFNERLSLQGLAYEGALYRKVVEDENVIIEHDNYLFVGFNMMQKVEQKFFYNLRKKANCHFYWDYDQYYINGKNEAGHYVSQYLAMYGNKLGEQPDRAKLYDNMSQKKDITYLSAATESIQARYVHDWLLENDRYKAGRATAIVLGDESLLPTVIHSLPSQKELKESQTESDELKFNITLGYPLQQTPFFSLVMQLIQLQTLGHPVATNTYRLKYVNKILRHPYARLISTKHSELLCALGENKQFYPSREFLSMGEDEGMTVLFSDLEAAENYNLALTDYIVAVLKTIGTHAKEEHDPLFQESLFRTYTVINRLRGLIKTGDLLVDRITLERLIQQLFQSTTIPFHGEPAEGVQIMGVLETRNLDFEHILVLSCNEGNLPKGVNDSSFIPYSIRKAHDLTTIDNKVAIYAYYFLRMIQRAGDITISYNNSTEDGHTGEMSRFMLQLMVESEHKIYRKSLTVGQNTVSTINTEIEKTEQIMSILNRQRLITPTFLNTFIRCGKCFYYKYIMDIKQPEDLEEEVDNRNFGNIFHRAAHLFYLRFASATDLVVNENGDKQLVHPIVISKGDIESALKHDKLFYELVDEAFREVLFKVKKGDFRLDYNGLQLINREVMVTYLKKMVKTDMQMAPFTIKGLELMVKANFDFDTSSGKKRLSMGGYIDRLDAVAANGKPSVDNLAERIRVIDYKTGRALSTVPKDIPSLFDTKELKKHTDYYLQAFLYSIIVKKDPNINRSNDPVSPALLFVQQSGAEGYDPTLKLGKNSITDVSQYEKEFWECLGQLVADIYNPQKPFVPTEDKKRCETCPYKALCK